MEGMAPEVLIGALRDCGAELDGETAEPKNAVTREDFYDLGLSGGTDSSAKRKALCHALGLPERISAKGLIEALNVLYSEEEYNKALKEI